MSARTQPPPLEAVIQSNIHQMQEAQKYHYSYFSSGLHGIFTAVEIPGEKDKAVWTDVINALNSAIQNYLKQSGNSETAQKWIDAMKAAAPPEDRSQVMTLPTTGEFATPISRVDSLKAALFSQGRGSLTYPGGRPPSQSTTAAPTVPPKPPARTGSQNSLAAPPLARSSSVEPSAFSGLSPYPFVNVFLEANGRSLYAEPDSEMFKLEKTSERDVYYEYAEACAFLINHLRKARKNLNPGPKNAEEIPRLTIAIQQVAEKGVQVFRDTIRDFSAKAHTLSEETLNERLQKFSVQLNDLSLAVNPAEKGMEPRHSREIRAREKELRESRNTLRCIEENAALYDRLIPDISGKACLARREYLDVPSRFEILFAYLEYKIKETDFSKSELGFSSYNIDVKFFGFYDHIAKIKKDDLHPLYKEGKISYIGMEECLKKADALRVLLVTQADEYQRNFSKEGLKKFLSIKSELSTATRTRAMTEQKG